MKNIIIMLISLSTVYLSQCYAAGPLQQAVSIHSAIRHFAATHLSDDIEYQLTLGQLDNRLQLPLCPEALEVFTHTGGVKPGRNSIGVKCNSAKKWTIYMPVMINVFEHIITLSQPIRRGDIISQNMLSREKKDVSTLRSGYMTNPKFIINKQATRNLGIGSVITKSNITEPKVIQRGDNVSIKINSQNLDISMAGIAMMNGIKGQNIRVKNVKTKKVIQAIVVNSGLVLITL